MSERPESGRIDGDPFAPERIEASIAAVLPAGTEDPDSS
jgi:hypothetical protein